MRTIIAGSRTINDYEELKYHIGQFEQQFNTKITQVISGGAYGVDRMGEKYAKENNIPLTIKPAEWTKYGKSAGYRRNVEMAACADAAIILWDGESRGSQHMINISQNYKLALYTVTI